MMPTPMIVLLPLLVAALGPFLSMTSCSAPGNALDSYRPPVRAARADLPRYEADLAECRRLALQVQGTQGQRIDTERGGNVVTGIAASEQVKDVLKAAPARATPLPGAVEAPADLEALQDHPRRLVDSCLVERGYVLGDPSGRG